MRGPYQYHFSLVAVELKPASMHQFGYFYRTGFHFYFSLELAMEILYAHRLEQLCIVSKQVVGDGKL